MGLVSDVFADFVEVQLHRFGVGSWQHQSSSGSAFRTDGAEQVGVLIALIGRQARPRSLLRPDANAPILLPNAGFILKPHLNWRAIRQVGYMGCERVGEVFLNALITCGS